MLLLGALTSPSQSSPCLHAGGHPPWQGMNRPACYFGRVNRVSKAVQVHTVLNGIAAFMLLTLRILKQRGLYNRD